MRFRIVAGSGPRSVPPAEGLETVHDSPGLLVEAGPSMARATLAGGGALLFGGYAVGAAATDVARGGGRPGDVRGTVQGRYVAIVCRPDGSCDVFTDRFAQADVYYQRTGDVTVIASDLSLLPVSADGDRFDQAALAHALCVFGWRPPKQHTFYRSVRRIGVDEWLTADRAGVRVVEEPFQPRPTGEYTEAHLEDYSNILLGAVEARSSRAGNVVYLSSGWDSTAILACLVRLHGKGKVRAVLGRMRYAHRSGVINQFEVDRATAIANYYGVRLELAEFDYRDGGPDEFDGIRPTLRAHNICGLGALNHWLLARKVAQTTGGGEAIFAGEISDGAHNLGFSQFLSIFHPSLDFREYSDKMLGYLFGPSFVTRFADGRFDDAVYDVFRSRCGGAAFDEPAGDPVSRRRQILSSFFLRANRLPLWSLANTSFLTAAGREQYASEMEGTYLARAASDATAETLYSWYLHLYNSFHWQGSTVATIALTAELQGLHVQLPFWDAGVQAFLSAMPESWGRGLDFNHTKFPLKWMLKNKIDYPYHLQTGPHSYLYDVNPQFSLAAEVLFASAFGPYLRQALSARPYRRMLSAEVFDLDYIDRIVDHFLAGEHAVGAELSDMTLLCWMSAVGAYGV